MNTRGVLMHIKMTNNKSFSRFRVSVGRFSARLVGMIYILLTLGCSANADQFQEGKHYSVLENATVPTEGKVKVVEFFNYACPHCYHLEEVLTEWKGSKADYIEFDRMPAFWNPLFKHMAQAYYTAVLLNKIDQLHSPIFKALHVTNRNIKDPESLSALFQEYGVEEKEFNKTYSSFAVQQKLSLASAKFKEYQLRAVPSFVIDGVYITSMREAGDTKTLIEIINFLAKKAKMARLAEAAPKE